MQSEVHVKAYGQHKSRKIFYSDVLQQATESFYFQSHAFNYVNQA